jgi:hypothetical protein
MRGYFGLGKLSASEKSDILDQHKSVYNGYQTMQPQVSNTQPLTVYDFAGDKEGLVVNNKGEVKKYTNMGINEQVEEKSMCEECGGQMTEGECMECGYNEGEMGEGKKFPDLTGDGEVTYSDILKGRGVKPKNSKTDKAIKKVNNISKKHGMEEDDSDWDATLMDGLEEETGHLDDIYNVRDLNMDSGFDYIEGGSNDVDTFEGMHKNLYREDEEEDMVDYENDDNEDDGFLDDQLDEDQTDDKPYEKGKFGMKASRARASFEPTPKEKDILDKLFGQYGDDIPPIVIRYLRKLPRKVFTKRLQDLGLLDTKADVKEQGGNVDDMNVSDVESAYDFESNGPMDGGDSYPVNEYEYETMESAFADEIDEVDVSGSQGIYGDMDPAYDFDSDGPGKGGPYQEFSHGTVHSDLDDEFEEIDEDLQEDFKTQKNKIKEMFDRFNKYN